MPKHEHHNSHDEVESLGTSRAESAAEIAALPIAEQLREVKLRLRAAMNGPVSAKMRQMGVAYRLNFGVDLPRLREIADELPHTTTLSIALWKEDIRECRHLATMLMPESDFDEDLAELWIEQLRYIEEAESLVMNLLQHTPYASSCIFRLIASDHRLTRLTGWLLVSRLLMQNMVPTMADADEILDHLEAELNGTDQDLRQAAYRALLKYIEIDSAAEARGERILKRLGL